MTTTAATLTAGDLADHFEELAVTAETETNLGPMFTVDVCEALAAAKIRYGVASSHFGGGRKRNLQDPVGLRLTRDALREIAGA